MNFPQPTLDRETAMKLWIKEHSEYAKEQVILNNIRLIPLVIKSLNISLSDEDYYSVGIIGLTRAINEFDESKGNQFSTYAVWVIRNEILKTFRKKRIIPAFSLDEPYRLDNGELVDFLEAIVDSRGFEEEVIADVQEEKWISSLNEREKKIASLRMEGKTQMEIAKICGISQAQVSRIIKSAYKKWRKQNETL